MIAFEQNPPQKATRITGHIRFYFIDPRLDAQYLRECHPYTICRMTGLVLELLANGQEAYHK